MTPEQSLASYRRFLTDSITVIRYSPGTTDILARATKVRARVMNYQPQEMSKDIMQGDRKAIILVQDLDLQNFPMPLVRGDVLQVQGKTFKLNQVDDQTRKVGTTLIAYECQARGS